tara:strand:+ start:2674 stop:3027 length:354 start_codon:yes stop_codon:yes gene_type:complete
MANNKQIIISLIKEYMEYNNELTDLQNKIKIIKAKKKSVSENLIKFMESNNIDEFDINDGKIVHKKVKSRASINKIYLLSVLNNYFSNNPDIDNEDLGKFIFDNRPTKETSSLVVKK